MIHGEEKHRPATPNWWSEPLLLKPLQRLKVNANTILDSGTNCCSSIRQNSATSSAEMVSSIDSSDEMGSVRSVHRAFYEPKSSIHENRHFELFKFIATIMLPVILLIVALHLLAAVCSTAKHEDGLTLKVCNSVSTIEWGTVTEKIINMIKKLYGTLQNKSSYLDIQAWANLLKTISWHPHYQYLCSCLFGAIIFIMSQVYMLWKNKPDESVKCGEVLSVDFSEDCRSRTSSTTSGFEVSGIKVHYKFNASREWGPGWKDSLKTCLTKLEGVSANMRFSEISRREGVILLKCSSSEDAGKVLRYLEYYFYGQNAKIRFY